jgi:hypothetical protein
LEKQNNPYLLGFFWGHWASVIGHSTGYLKDLATQELLSAGSLIETGTQKKSRAANPGFFRILFLRDYHRKSDIPERYKR